MIEANNSEKLYRKLSEDADPKLLSIVNSKGFSNEELDILSIDDLRRKIDLINEILANEKKQKNYGFIDYKRGKDYRLPENEEPSTGGYRFSSNRILLEKKKEVLELIRRKSQDEKINSLGDLIDNIKESELKEKLEKELLELREQSKKLNTEQDLVSQEEKGLEATKKQLEISRSRLDILERKSQIWLNILARESIASIIGAFLLIVLSVCLIVAMFMKLETTKIIESAFLLILGYFFGQAVSKK